MFRKRSRFERYLFEFLIAIEIIMSFTFLGYIHVPPISIATAYIPIVIAGCLFGPAESGVAGMVFGFGSMYKASTYYAQAADMVFSPLRSGFTTGSILLSVGTRTVFGLMIGGLFRLVKKSKYRPVWNGGIALIAPQLHAFLVFSAMGLFFPKLGYTAASVLQMAKSDMLIALLCLVSVEICDFIYNTKRMKKFQDAINQPQETSYWSSRVVAGIVIVTIFVVTTAAFATSYFSERSSYILQKHGIEVSPNLYNDIINLQIQFLLSMLSLNFILVLVIIIVYRYMKYREYLGELDALTGVMGRRMFLHHCESVQKEQKDNTSRKGWFLFLDVDWFKKINDSLGHMAGDETLCKVAQNLQNLFGKIGAVGRVGGDEFAVMIEETMTREQLEKYLNQFQRNISMILPERKVSCSIGVYHFTFPKEIKHLLRETDNALYMAKERGRACYVVQEAETDEAGWKDS